MVYINGDTELTLTVKSCNMNFYVENVTIMDSMEIIAACDQKFDKCCKLHELMSYISYILFDIIQISN